MSSVFDAFASAPVGAGVATLGTEDAMVGADVAPVGLSVRSSRSRNVGTEGASLAAGEAGREQMQVIAAAVCESGLRRGRADGLISRFSHMDAVNKRHQRERGSQ